MRRLTSVLLAIVIVVPLLPYTLQAQEPAIAPNPHFSPDVPTIWHKLGVPQSVGRFKKFRESRVNRKGNHPEREKKPRLLKLTDPANLAPDAPKMLQAAAQIKKAEDLAPQKLKALKYLATIGCGCYNKKNADLVEGALLEALEDCTASVRTEALNVIMAQVSGGCSCSCEPACNPSSCCTPKLYKKLDELANKTDDTGCPLEPDPAIRAMAMNVLNACPYPNMPPEEEPEVAAKPEVVDENESQEGAESLEPTFSNDGFEGTDPGETRPRINGPTTDEIVPIEKDGDLFDRGNDGNQTSRRGSTRANQVSYSSNRQGLPGTPSLTQYSGDDREFMQQLEITGVVRSVRNQEGNATIVFDDPYQFPVGLSVVLATSPEHASFGTVEVTQVGTAVVRVEDYALLNNLKNSQRIRMGVFK